MAHTTRATARRAAVCAAAVSVAITVADCSAFGDEPRASEQGRTTSHDAPDVSADGRVDYACALATEVQTKDRPFTMNTLGIDDRPSAETFQISGATGLLGAVTGSHLPGHEKLSDAAAKVYTGLASVDLQKLNGSIDDLAQRCVESDLPKGDPDISGEGRVAYACALAKDLKTHDGPVSSWNLTPGDDADPAQHKAAGAAGLLGGPVSGVVPGHTKLSAAARYLYAGLTQMRPQKAQKGLDDLARGCRQV